MSLPLQWIKAQRNPVIAVPVKAPQRRSHTAKTAEGAAEAAAPTTRDEGFFITKIIPHPG
jgi:hypothetical protein